ncbi:MAG: RNA polymerase sigma factor [Verrucomicrobiota bacterium]
MAFGWFEKGDFCGEFEEKVQSGYRYALSLCGKAHDAEDLTQEAVVKVLRRYGDIEKKGLLYRTIRNLYFDEWRRSKIVQMDSVEAVELERIPEDGRGTLGREADIEYALSILNANERELLYLRYRDGFSATEIGKLINKERGTVLSALYRAEKKMKQLFASDLQKVDRK